MARGGKGHIVPVTLTQVLAADIVRGFAFGVFLYVFLAPYFIARIRSFGWLWEMAALAGAIVVLFVVILPHMDRIRRRLEPLLAYHKQTYELAKARRDLSLNTSKMSMIEGALMGLFLGLFLVVSMSPILVLVRFAALNLRWIDPTAGVLLVTLPILVLFPLFGASWRLSVYVAINLAAKLR